MGEKDPFVGSFKDLDAHFIFQFLYGFRKAWLGDEEGLGSAAQGTCFGNGDDIAQLLEGHDILLLSGAAIGKEFDNDSDWSPQGFADPFHQGV